MKLELPLADVRRVAELLVDSVVRNHREDIPLRDRVLEALRLEANQRAPKPASAPHESTA